MGVPNPLPQLRRILAELRRRRVPHAIGVYGVVAWIVVQVAAIAFPALYLPKWAVALVVLFAVLGFPVVTVVSWAFELTPEGFRKTPEAAGPAAIGYRGRVLLVVAVVGFTAVLGWLGWATWIEPRAGEPGTSEGTATGPVLDPARVAVLYFDDHSPGDSLAHFARGLTEDLIHRLAQVDALEVVSRHGVKPYRAGRVTMDSVARALRAGSLVEGSIQARGEELEVTVQLIDGRTQTHLMSTSVRRPVGDLFALEDSLVTGLSRLLRRRLGRTIQLERGRSETESVEAWDRLQRARELREDADRLTAQGDRETARRLVSRADSLLAAAEEADSDWNRPRVLRARLVQTLVDVHEEEWSVEDRRLVRAAMDHAGRAVDHDPEDPRALAARGELRYWLSRHTAERSRSRELAEAAERDLRRAVGLDAGSARGWYALSEVMLHTGETREALYAARRAREADAFLTMAPRIYSRLFEAAVNEPDFQTAGRWCRAGRREYPDRVVFSACALALLASSGGPEPDVDRARELAAEIGERADAGQRPYWSGIARRRVAAVLARAGLEDSARAVLRRARRSRTSPPHTYEEAHVLLLLGEEERALDRLDAFAEALPQYVDRLADDPWFAPLRDHPRFRELVQG